MQIPDEGTLLQRTKKDLVNWLISSNIPSGSKLPSKRDFAFLFKVSELTVSNAVAALADTGILETRPSRGTYLVSPPKRRIMVDAYFPETWREILQANQTSHHSYYIYRQYLDGLLFSCAQFGVALTIEYVRSADYFSLATAPQSVTRDGALFYIYGNEEQFEQLRKRGVLYASLTTGVARWENEVGVDYESHFKTVLTTLCAGASKSFGLLGFPASSGRELEQTAIIRAILAQHGHVIAPEHHIVRPPYDSRESLRICYAEAIRKMNVIPEVMLSCSAFDMTVFVEVAQQCGKDWQKIRYVMADFPQSAGFHAPDVTFLVPPFFQQSIEALRIMAECTAQGSTVFSQLNLAPTLMTGKNDGHE